MVLEKEFGAMATQADLDAAIAALKDEVATDVANVMTQLKALQSELATAQGGSSSALDAAVASLNQTTAELHAKYATVPVPTTTPAS